MELDYCEIMDLPEPLDGADIGVLETLSRVYRHLVDKFTKAVNGPREDKDCYLQRARFAFFSQRLAFNQRALKRAQNNLRKGEIYNFALRVRTWVLECAERRAQMRNLIGEARIRAWQDKRRALETHSSPHSHSTDQHGFHKVVVQKSPENKPTDSGRKNDRQRDVGNWYRLASLPRRSRSHHGPDILAPKPKKIKGGTRRAIPTAVFWPHELADDYLQYRASVKNIHTNTLKPRADNGGKFEHVNFTDKFNRDMQNHISRAREGPIGPT